MALGAWLGKLFGTDEAMKAGVRVAEQSVGSAIKGIDALVYTNEEKISDVKDMVFKLQDQFTPRAISRRILAIMFTTVFLGLCIVAVIFACFGATAIVNDIINIAIAFHLGWIMLSIVAFYFGFYQWGKLKKS